MANRYRIMHKNKLIDTYSGTSLIDFSSNEEKTKFFGIVAMCGHCGRGYYVPILFGYRAKDIDEAKNYVMQTARVKRDRDCILCIGEIDETTYRIIEAINDNDGYLRPAEYGFDDKDVEDRKVVMELRVGHSLKNEDKKTRERQLECTSIRTADMYPENLVLQRTFAPRLNKTYTKQTRVNGKIIDEIRLDYIFPSKVKLSDFLEDYLTAEVFKLGVNKRKLSVVSRYYQLYGKNNKLGIKYKNGVISFVDKDKIKRSFEVSDNMRIHLEKEDIGYLHEEERKDPYEEILKIAGNEKRALTGLERFNRKMRKTLEKGIEPGEEE